MQEPMHPIVIVIILGIAVICLLAIAANYILRYNRHSREKHQEGKTAFDLWREILGNEDKDFNDYIDSCRAPREPPDDNQEKIYYKDLKTGKQRLLNPDDPSDAKMIKDYHRMLKKFNRQLNKMTEWAEEFDSIFKVDK